jgi:hypothetical protein
VVSARSAIERPEAKALLAKRPVAVAPGAPSAGVPKPAAAPRAFNQAERALIRNLHAHMPAEQLLDILNTRLVADVGARAVPFTTQQLQEDVARHVDAAVCRGRLGRSPEADRAGPPGGTAQTLTLQLVDDFSVVFRLSPAQHMRLRDVIKNAQEER